MIKNNMSRLSSIIFSLQMIAVPLALAYVCNIISSNSIETGFPQIWTLKYQIIATAISSIVLLLPCPYNRWLRHDLKKRNIAITDSHNFIALIVGLALTTMPGLIGFFLFIFGGKIFTTYLFLLSSFLGGTVWIFYSFTTYFKKPANNQINRTENTSAF